MTRLLVLVPLVVFAGCNDGRSPSAGTPTTAKTPAASDDMKLVTYDQLDAEIQSHKGSVLVVDVWSTGCPTCIKKMPGIAKIYDDLKGKGLVVLGLNTDEPEDTPKAKSIVAKNSVHFPMLQFKDTEDAEKKWDATYPLSPQPMVWVYKTASLKAMGVGVIICT